MQKYIVQINKNSRLLISYAQIYNQRLEFLLQINEFPVKL